MSEKIPIIVGGFYRSGTTLVRRLLDSHSNIHCSPEIKFFRDLDQDYANDPLGHVRFFATLPSMGLVREEILAVFGPAFVAAHEYAATKVGKSRWADKNPENVMHLDDWQAILPQGFFFVHVVRNPFDALASLKSIGFEKTLPRSFEAKASLLKSFRDAGERYVALNPKTSTTICYEALVRSPEETVTDLFLKLGELPELAVLNTFHQPERGRGIEDPKINKTNSVHSKSIGRGKKELNLREIEIVERIMCQAARTKKSESAGLSRLWRFLGIRRQNEGGRRE
jgi:hypothetical protein